MANLARFIMRLCVTLLRSAEIRGRTRGRGGSTSALVRIRTCRVQTPRSPPVSTFFAGSSRSSDQVGASGWVRRLRPQGWLWRAEYSLTFGRLVTIDHDTRRASWLRGGLAQPRNAAETRTAACHHCSRDEGLKVTVFRGITKCPPRSLRTGVARA